MNSNQDDRAKGAKRWLHARRYDTPVKNPGPNRISCQAPEKPRYGNGRGPLVAAFVVLSFIGVGSFAAMWRSPFASSVPVFEDIHRDIDYSDFTSTALAHDKVRNHLVIGSKGGGLTHIDSKTLRPFTETSDDGLSSNQILDLAVDKEGALLALTQKSGLGIDLRDSTGVFRQLIAPNSIPDLSADKVIGAAANQGELSLLLRDGRLIQYDQSRRVLSEAKVAGGIPQPVTSFANREKGGFWLAAAGGLYVLEHGPSGYGVKSVAFPRNEEIVSVVAAQKTVLLKSARGAIYRDDGNSWRMLVSGGRWKDLDFKKVRHIAAPEDSSTLWLFFDTECGFYDFRLADWFVCETKDIVSFDSGFLKPILTPDGQSVLLPGKEDGFVLLTAGERGFLSHQKIGPENEIVVALNSQGDEILATTVRRGGPGDGVRRVWRYRWKRDGSNELIKESLLRRWAPSEIGTPIAIKETPQDSLQVLDDNGRLFAYDLKLRGLSQTPTPWSPEDFEDITAGLINTDYAWIAHQDGLSKLGFGERKDQAPIAIGSGTTPTDSSIESVLSEGDQDLEIIFQNGDVYAYNFSGGWKQNAQNIDPKNVRKYDGGVIALDTNGQLMRRWQGRWERSTSASPHVFLSLGFGQEKIPAVLKSGASVWINEDGEVVPWIAAPPNGVDAPAPPFSAMVVHDSRTLLIGDSRGILSYNVKTHQWRRRLNKKSTNWSIYLMPQKILAWDQENGDLFVSGDPGLEFSKSLSEVVHLNVHEDQAIASTQEGLIFDLTGRPKDLGFLAVSTDKDLSSDGPTRGAAFFAKQLLVIDSKGRLLSHDWNSGTVALAKGPWEKSELTKIIVTNSSCFVADSEGYLYSSDSSSLSFSHLRTPRELKVRDIAQAGSALVARDENDGLLVWNGDWSVFAGGKNPADSPGSPTCALGAENTLWLGGPEGLALRAPEDRRFVKSSGPDTGAVERFSQIENMPIAWAENGVFVLQNGNHIQLGPRSLQSVWMSGPPSSTRLLGFDRELGVLFLTPGEDPKPLGAPGGHLEGNSPIKMAIALEGKRSLHLHQDGKVSSYDFSSRHIRSILTPRESRKSLFKISDNSFLIVESDAAHLCDLKNGQELRNSMSWKISANPLPTTKGVFLVLADHQVILVSKDGVDEVMPAAEDAQNRQDVVEILAKDHLLYLRSKNDGLWRYDPETGRSKELSAACDGLFPLGQNNVVFSERGELHNVERTSSTTVGNPLSIRGANRMIASRGISDYTLISDSFTTSIMQSSGQKPKGEPLATWNAEGDSKLYWLAKDGVLHSYEAEIGKWNTESTGHQGFDEILGNRESIIGLGGPECFKRINDGELESCVGRPVIYRDAVLLITPTGKISRITKTGRKELYEQDRLSLNSRKLLFCLDVNGGSIAFCDKEQIFFPDSDSPPSLVSGEPMSGKPVQVLQPNDDRSSIYFRIDKSVFRADANKVELVAEDADLVHDVASGGVIIEKAGRFFFVADGRIPIQLTDLDTRPYPRGRWVATPSDESRFSISTSGNLIWQDKERQRWQSIKSAGTSWEKVESAVTVGSHSMIQGRRQGRTILLCLAKSNGDLTEEFSMELGPKGTWGIVGRDQAEIPIGKIYWRWDGLSSRLVGLDETNGRLMELRPGTESLLHPIVTLAPVTATKNDFLGRLLIQSEGHWMTLAEVDPDPTAGTFLPKHLGAIEGVALQDHKLVIKFASGTSRIDESSGNAPTDAKFARNVSRDGLSVNVSQGKCSLTLDSNILFALEPGSYWPGSSRPEVLIGEGKLFAFARNGSWRRINSPEEIEGSVLWSQGIWSLPVPFGQMFVRRTEKNEWSEIAIPHSIEGSIPFLDNGILDFRPIPSLSSWRENSPILTEDGIATPVSQEFGIAYGPRDGTPFFSTLKTIEAKSGVSAQILHVEGNTLEYLGQSDNSLVFRAANQTRKWQFNLRHLSWSLGKLDRSVAHHATSTNSSARIQQQQGSMVVRTLQDSHGREFDFTIGSFPDTTPKEFSLTDSGTIFVRMRNYWIWNQRKLQEALVGKSASVQREANRLHEPLRLRDGSLQFEGVGNSGPVEIGSLTSSRRFPIDQVSDFMPSPEGIYEMTPAGVILRTSTARHSVRIENGTRLGQGTFAIAPNFQRTVCVKTKNGVYVLSGYSATKNNLITHTDLHSSSADFEGELGQLKWKRRGDAIYWQVRLGEDQWSPTQFMGGAFAHELAVEIYARGDSIVAQGKGNIDRVIGGTDEGELVPHQQGDKISPPKIVSIGDSHFSFRQNANQSYELTVSKVGGLVHPIPFIANKKGRFAHDIISSACERDGWIFSVTPGGIFRNSLHNDEELEYIAALPFPWREEIRIALDKKNELLCGQGQSVYRLLGSQWTRVSAEGTPFSSTHGLALTTSRSPWRLSSLGDGKIAIEHRANQGVRIPFDPKDNCLAIDHLPGEDIEASILDTTGIVIRKSSIGWLADAGFGIPQRLQMKPLSKPRKDIVDAPSVTMTMARRASEEPLGYLEVGTGKRIQRPWVVRNGRLAFDRINDCAFDPNNPRTVLLATDAGLRVSRRRDGGWNHGLVQPLELPGPVGDFAISKAGDLAVLGSKKGFSMIRRKSGMWKRSTAAAFAANKIKESIAASQNESMQIQWQTKEGKLTVVSNAEKGSPLSLALSSEGFNFDSPDFLFKEVSAYGVFSNRLHELVSPELGAFGWAPRGQASEKSTRRKRSATSFGVVVERKGKSLGRNPSDGKYSRVIESEDELCAHLTGSAIAVESLKDSNLSIRVRRSQKLYPNEWCKMTLREGRFLHDDIRSIEEMTVSANGAVTLLLATAGGIAIRDGDTGELLHILGTDPTTRLIRQEGKIIAESKAGEFEIDLGKAPIQRSPGQSGSDRQVIHSEPFLSIYKQLRGETPYGLSYGRPAPLAPMTIDLKWEGGHLPGDRVLAAYRIGERLLTMTPEGMTATDMPLAMPIPGWVAPENPNGRISTSPRVVRFNDELWFSSKEESPSISFTTNSYGKRSVEEYPRHRPMSGQYMGLSWLFENDALSFMLDIPKGANSEAKTFEVKAVSGALSVDLGIHCSTAGGNPFVVTAAGVRPLKGAQLGALATNERFRTVAAQEPIASKEDRKARPFLIAETSKTLFAWNEAHTEVRPNKSTDLKDELSTTLTKSEDWHLKRIGQDSVLTLKSRPHQVSLHGSEIFSHGQFAFDSPIATVEQEGKAWVITKKTVEVLEDGRLHPMFQFPGEAKTISVGDSEVLVGGTAGQFILSKGRISQATNKKINPEFALRATSENIQFMVREGNLLVNGRPIDSTPSDIVGLSAAENRLWILTPGRLHWLRLNGKWRKKILN